ncbi:hypothetical protein [Saccharopolyspora rosea]|uniref:Uncharacterized protein n=1 Tax=Saccharopolyspora rosea TaxID=524884 RepID=A0ABW3FJ24_9PSEU|nr:hypothetical protein [Saccharopolyspora rosea]
MSQSDRTTGGTRRWRLLTRALVVAGATVAGTSAAWLIGSEHSAHAADLHLPSAVSSVVGGQADAGAERGDPAAFSLHDLDPVHLVRSAPRQLIGAAEPVTKPVTGALHDSAAEVGDVAGKTLDDTAHHAQSLSRTVDSGLSGLGRPLLPERPGPDPAPQPQPQPQEAQPAPAPAPAPEVHAPAPVGVPTATTTRAPQHAAVTPERDQRSRPDSPAEPGKTAPFAMPAPSGASGSGGTADGPHHGGGLGWYPVEPDAHHPLAAVLAREHTFLPVGVPEPQPGTTPD